MVKNIFWYEQRTSNKQTKKNARYDLDKDLFKLMNNSVFGKTMKNARKHCDIKLSTNDERSNYLVSKPNYHPAKCLSEMAKIASNSNENHQNSGE